MADHISAKVVKIRKQQKCWGCAQLFNPGTHMHSVTTKECGNISKTWWCLECDDYINTMSSDERAYLQDGLLLGELRKL